MTAITAFCRVFTQANTIRPKDDGNVTGSVVCKMTTISAFAAALNAALNSKGLAFSGGDTCCDVHRHESDLRVDLAANPDDFLGQG